MRRAKCNMEKDKAAQALESDKEIEFFATTHAELTVQILIEKVVRYSDVDGETLAVLDVVRQDGESIGEARATDTAGGADGGGTSGGISVAAFEEALRDDEEALAAEFGIPPLAGALPGEIPGETNMEVVEEPEEEELSVEEAVAGVRSDAEPFNWVLIAPKAGATPRTPRANMG